MRSPKLNLSAKSATGWSAAVALLAEYLKHSTKADQLLDTLPASFSGQRRSTCQSLFFGALRNGHLIREALRPLLTRRPKPLVEAILMTAGYETIAESEERWPKIVHHAVEQSKSLASRPEQKFLNAVLRKLPPAIQAARSSKSPAIRFSHPQWLAKHWRKEFPDAHAELLEWNQQISSNYLRFYDTNASAHEFLEATRWDGFFKVGPAASWQDDILPLLTSGSAYIKDPSTRLAPTLLDPRPGQSILDLCAAPGGKSFEMARLANHTGHLVAIDMGDDRIDRLKENLSKLQCDSLRCDVLDHDLLTLKPETLFEASLPDLYEAVMLDAPCSNTGVMQRRPDVKWRLSAKDFKECAELQKKLIQSAAQFVSVGGRLVYSTCSIEEIENLSVVEDFLQTELGQKFALKDQIISYPWETGHDGAGAFLLVRNS